MVTSSAVEERMRAVLSIDTETQADRQDIEDQYVRWLGSKGRWGEIAKPMAELVGGLEDIPVIVPEALRGGFIPSSPSVNFNPDGERRRAIVRGVNYRQSCGQKTLFEGNEERCCTRNWWVAFDRRWRVAWCSTMDDPNPKRPGAVQGLEDCRLFHAAGRYWASATFAERPQLFGPSAYGLLCEMALLQISDDGVIEDVKALRGPWSIYHQKNWKPAPTRDEPLRWIYSSEPLLTVTPLMATEKHSVKWCSASPWRGGSQAVRIGSHWLWLDHRPVVDFDGPRNLYLHRFVMADDQLTKIEAVSAPFVFRAYEVEFCAGLTIDGDHAVISYSIKDALPFLAVVPIESIIRTLGRPV